AYRTLPMISIAFLIAACGGTQSGAAPSSNVLQSVGAGEGALNLIAWTGYVESGKTDPKVDWVTPFQKQTGCNINVKFADTSDELGADLGPQLALQRQGGRLRQSDLHRRRRPLPQDPSAQPAHNRCLRADRDSADGVHQPAQAAGAADQEVLVSDDRRDRSLQ